MSKRPADDPAGPSPKHKQARLEQEKRILRDMLPMLRAGDFDLDDESIGVLTARAAGTRDVRVYLELQDVLSENAPLVPVPSSQYSTSPESFPASQSPPAAVKSDTSELDTTIQTPKPAAGPETMDAVPIPPRPDSRAARNTGDSSGGNLPCVSRSTTPARLPRPPPRSPALPASLPLRLVSPSPPPMTNLPRRPAPGPTMTIDGARPVSSTQTAAGNRLLETAVAATRSPKDSEASTTNARKASKVRKAIPEDEDVKPFKRQQKDLTRVLDGREMLEWLGGPMADKLADYIRGLNRREQLPAPSVSGYYLGLDRSNKFMLESLHNAQLYLYDRRFR